MSKIRRISPILEARQMPLYPTAEECNDICNWIAQDLGHSDDQINDYGVGKDPVTGLVQLRTRYGIFLIGLGHWVIRNGEHNYEIIREGDFLQQYEVIEEDVPEEEVPVEPAPVEPEPEKESI